MRTITRATHPSRYLTVTRTVVDDQRDIGVRNKKPMTRIDESRNELAAQTKLFGNIYVHICARARAYRQVKAPGYIITMYIS